MNIIISNTCVDGETVDIAIIGTKIIRIGSGISADYPDARIIDGSGTAALSSFVNGHTHSPMVLLRGAGDDLPLYEWLQTRMWPLEDEFEEEDFYWGNRLAFLEMIRTGTGFFNEMYMEPLVTMEALKSVPLKAMISFPVMDLMDEEKGKERCRACEDFFNKATPTEKVKIGVAIHALYTNSRYSIEWVRDFTAERGVKVHIHLAETMREFEECKEANGGLTPTEYLHSLGLLKGNVVAAHAVHLTDKDIDILADAGVTVIHNPVSNMKLSSGVFPYKRLKEKGVPILLGTDGVASNNNLNMIEEMKIATLLQKVDSMDPTLMTAQEIFRIATAAGAECFETGGGELKEGMEADIMLIDLMQPEMNPLWNLTSSLVYAASSQCVKTLLSGGEVLMENRIVPGEKEVLEEAGKRFSRLRQIDSKRSS